MSQMIDIKPEQFYLAGNDFLGTPAYTCDDEMVPKCEQEGPNRNPSLMCSVFYKYRKFKKKSFMLVRVQEIVNIQLTWHKLA